MLINNNKEIKYSKLQNKQLRLYSEQEHELMIHSLPWCMPEINLFELVQK